MPSKSEKQEKLMRIVAHDKKFAEKVGIPQSVGKEFYKEDKKERFKKLKKKLSKSS